MSLQIQANEVFDIKCLKDYYEFRNLEKLTIF